MSSTPKRGTPEFHQLYERLRDALDASTLSTLLEGAVDRGRTEKLVRRIRPELAAGIEKLPRHDLMESLVQLFFEGEDPAADVVLLLDRATEAERNLVGSTESSALEELASHPTLRLKRHGARLVWALLRDARAEAQSHTGDVIRAYLEETDKLSRARQAARDKGAGQEVEELDAIYSAVERDRADLLAKIGRREAELRIEAKKREELAAELAKLKTSAPSVRAPEAADRSPEALERKLRKLEKRLGAAERSRDEMAEAGKRVAELEEDNARLRNTLDRLRELRSRERAERATLDAEPSKSVPAVEAPKRRKAKHRSDAARVGVFVDVANIAGAAWRIYGANVDYRKLLAEVVGGRRLIEARAYAIDKGRGFEGFARALREVGFKIHKKKPKTFDDGTVKADWDIGITVDVLTLYKKLDVVVLASGDGDFAPVVAALRKLGVQVEVVVFPARSAPELLREADRVIELDESALQ